ncbi:DNA repair protein XRCC3 [Carpediemonas membranifera]|uniref:DNA repair protein XRCC3 n=1 Tax=Carpediemonas membranifera TaxID=201153 RepID=A0A8J6E9I3_9EUKA|nr:DNA repair protein XRCC3 [Carpediemonas membranifera]|eukprot:KAG9393385.1 DNA repair protein XRCC3 [Carpediemonas membranifera]
MQNAADETIPRVVLPRTSLKSIIRSISIPAHLQTALESNGFEDVESILCASTDKLRYSLKCTRTEADTLKTEVSRGLLMTHESFVRDSTALTALGSQPAVINLGDSKIDSLIGGLTCGTITELCGEAGTGKCLARGTPVLMADGMFKLVEAIVPGDRLMGYDGHVERVLSAGTGREAMLRVSGEEGVGFTCNMSHILTISVHGLSPRVEYCSSADWAMTVVRLGKNSSGEVTSATVETTHYSAEQEASAAAVDASLSPAILTDGALLDIPARVLLDGSRVDPRVREAACMVHSGLIWAFEGDWGREAPAMFADAPARQKYLETVLKSHATVAESSFVLNAADHDTLLNIHTIAFIARSLGLKAVCDDGGTLCRIYGPDSSLPDLQKLSYPTQSQDMIRTKIISLEILPEDDYFGFTMTGATKRFIVTESMLVTHNTQFCIRAVSAATAQGYGALILNTEGGLWPIERVRHVSTRQPTYHERMTGQAPSTRPDETDPLDSVLMRNIANAEALAATVLDILPTVLQKHNIRLLVIDSLAAVIPSSGDPATRAQCLAGIGAALKQAAHVFHVAVVVTNHARDYFADEAITPAIIMGLPDYYGQLAAAKDKRDSGYRLVTPALGPVWSHMVNARLMLTRTPTGAGLNRELHVIHSDRVPVGSVAVTVDESGFKSKVEERAVAPGASSQWIY